MRRLAQSSHSEPNSGRAARNGLLASYHDRTPIVSQRLPATDETRVFDVRTLSGWVALSPRLSPRTESFGDPGIQERFDKVIRHGLTDGEVQ